MLLGMACLDNQYELLGRINDVLGIQLRLSDYIPFNLKDGKLFKFSLFHFMDEELGLEFFFIPNTSNFEEPNINAVSGADLFAGFDVDEQVKLVKELPKTDYFLIIKGDEVYNNSHKVIKKLKTLDEIIQLQTIEPTELPSKRNLIF